MSQGASGVVLFAGVGSLAVAAAGVAADEPITVLEGEARVAGTDHPAGRVTLRFYERGFTGEAVADSEGHFRWPTPEGMGLRAGADGQPGPSCQVLAQEEGRWSWEISGADLSPPNDFSRLQSLAGAFRPAETRWQARGGRPWLIVTCPPMGEVVVEVRGPDGATAADRPVRVVPAGSQTGFGGRTTVQFTGRTDGAGRLRIRWAEGVARLRVVVPGLGFGSTGLFEVVGGRETRPDLPPLARFARVEGTLDPRLAGPETTITLTSLFHDPRTWDHAQAVCDAGGHFVLEDVVPGAHSLVVDRAGKPVPIGPASIYPAPGGRIDGLTLHPPAPSPPGGPRPDPGMAGGPAPAGDRPEDIPWLEGTVRDEAGRPVAGADVFVHTSYHGGIRMYEDVRTATSDARGHYRIAGPVWEYMETLTVIVRAAGRPPVVAYAPTPSRSGGPPRTLDLTLAPEGGAVRVTVLKDGRPLPGAGVRLVSVGAVGLSDWAYVGRANGPGRAGIEALFQPAGRTGPDGVATFRGLFPGEYEVSAADRPNPAMPGFYRVWPHEPGLAFGVAEGVAVAAGGEVEHALAVHAQPGAVRLQVLRPDGSPATNRAVSFSFGLGDAGTSTSLKLDGQGIGTYDFTAPGLWTVDVRFRDSKLQSFPTNQEPYDQARALLPVSPGLTLDEPVSLRAVRRELGSMRVRLLDREGRPARGTVMIVGSFGLDPSVDHAGTTDPGGEVRFAGLPSGTYELRGAIDGLPPPFEPGPSGTYPDDAAALRGGVAVTGVPVRVETGTEASAELRTQAVGYLRGTIRPPAGHEASEYQIGFDDDRPGFQIPKRGDPQTGQITCGPLPAGMHVVRFFQGAGQAPWTSAGKQEVDVPAGDVARVDLRPVEAPKAPAADRPGVAFLGMGGISVLESTPSGAGGTVRRADGETPAFAARALLFVPDQDQAVASGISDAAGNLTWRGRWLSGSSSEARPGGRVATPTAVVWQPGASGAAVVAVDPRRPIRAVLPRPIAAAGRVTLGGRPLTGRNARVRIVAGHQGQGVLDAALSREATAQADGSFVLRGLTPGRYRVQAARDGIWLSPGVDLVAEAGADPPAVVLDIPEPGASVVLELKDRRGRRVPDRPVTLRRPEGPLAALWPTAFRSDSDGTITIRGLEAGTHEITIDGEPRSRAIRVREASADHPLPMHVPIELEAVDY